MAQSQTRARVAYAEREPIDGWDDARGKLGWTRLFSKGQTPTDSLTAGVLVLPPGGFISPHCHAPAEIYFVIEGEAVVVVEGETHVITGDGAIFIPGGAVHELRNAGETTLRIFYVFAVDGIADVRYMFADATHAAREPSASNHGTG